MGQTDDFLGGWDVVGSQEYKRMTLKLLDHIVSNDVGMIILSSIDRISKDVIIKARTAELIRADNCNAETHPESEKDAFKVGDRRTLFYGTPYDPSKTGAKDVRFERPPKDFKGTGKGSDVTIFFDSEDGGCYNNHTQVSSHYDDILIHELVHALRMAQGLINYVPTQNHRYGDVEEFLAIVVTNVYVSAKGGHRFRADHMGHHLLRRSLSTSGGFIHDIHNFRMLRKYRCDWLETFAELARVKTHFNPFREMLHYPPKEMSPVHRSHSLLFQDACPPR